MERFTKIRKLPPCPMLIDIWCHIMKFSEWPELFALSLTCKVAHDEIWNKHFSPQSLEEIINHVKKVGDYCRVVEHSNIQWSFGKRWHSAIIGASRIDPFHILATRQEEQRYFFSFMSNIFRRSFYSVDSRNRWWSEVWEVTRCKKCTRFFRICGFAGDYPLPLAMK